MALSFPLQTSFLWDLLPIASFSLGELRQDELSGTGDGRVWAAELAPPLWRAEVTLARRIAPVAKQHVAKLRALRGAQEAFFVSDPLSRAPAADPEGATLGTATVTISGIGSSRYSLSLAGLPGGYALTPGDKLSLLYGSSPTRYYFGEISEARVATSGGALADLAIYPALPVGVAVGAEVRLRNPYFKAIIAPESFSHGTAARIHIDAVSFTVLQKK